MIRISEAWMQSIRREYDANINGKIHNKAWHYLVVDVRDQVHNQVRIQVRGQVLWPDKLGKT
ncbi:MAG: hypothetical protein NWE83_04335 [Candidatus Bathyarchaeota archaeon]|nr:hypothetical protein [Candidatus Bathyarchaeota archaeon]